ncbi:hypothetical protein [Radiobacillus sp. PE A8.2]|uniref:hypothetical protein n=1 Tax=Radiobacillus sp. PE A8.2 TaxID=3380349 RepID=UPI0038900654
MWDLFKALENGEITEDAFYNVIERADSAYHKLDRKLDRLLEAYYVKIYQELIDNRR